MSIRIIRKALGLLIVDIVIIIGIFVLQFRTDSSIIEKIGNLQFTFSQIEDKDKNIIVQNKFRMTYNGLNFFFDDQTPVLIQNTENEMKPVTLQSWEKKDDYTYVLTFEDDLKLSLELASDNVNASLAVIADLPATVLNVSVPFNYASNMRIQKDDGNRIVLNGKKSSWEVSAFSLDSGYFSLNRKDFVGTYSIYDETQKFTFDSIIDMEIADAAFYERNIQIFKNNLISAFKTNTAESNLSEQVVVSYVAAQAENGNYVQAIEDIPASLKKNKQRTYLSAPYLNTLEDMNKILEKTIADYKTKLTESANSSSLDIFTIHNIADFICIHNNSEDMKKLLQNAAFTDMSAVTLAQATGILQVYVDLVKLDSSYAQYLVPALEGCVERITESCAYEGNVLTISENDTFLSVIQAVETGVAVMRYGIITGNETLQKAGRVLVDSYLTENSSYDLRTLANLYPIIAYDNWYYPHFQKIKTNDKNDLWAWTCAKNIVYEKDSEGAISITIDFPENMTHYVILKGIPSFSSIYIYNMAFRTDPRFETYNSSGYVYKQNTETLLLKSRHKTQLEVIRLEYREKAAVKTSTPKVEEKTKPVEVAQPKPVVETVPTPPSVPTPVTETPKVEPEENTPSGIEAKTDTVNNTYIETALVETPAVEPIIASVNVVEEETSVTAKNTKKTRKSRNSD